MQQSRMRLFSSVVAALLCVNTVDIHFSAHFLGINLELSQEAYGRSSGGRSGGGSFRRSSPSRSSSSPSRSSSSSSSPSRSYSSPSRRSSGSGPVIVPVPVTGGQPNYNSAPSSTSTNSASSEDDFPWFLVLLGLVGIGLLIWWVTKSKSKTAPTGSAQELENDTVTISKLQVALLAEAREVQAKLSEVSLAIDTDTPEGLAELLQESTLALLRTPENWTHVAVSSQTVRSREEAENLFNQLSVTERSKFSAETLVNVGGRVRQQQAIQPDAEDTAAYIVVTLLIGTADDQPLFGEIRSAEALKAALEKAAAIRSDYLMVFELLWSPQAESDSLTYDELLTEYTDMIQIA